MRRATRRKLVVVIAVPALVAGCSMFGEMFESKKVDYKSAGKLPTLEVPPDLTRPGRDERYAMPDVNPSGTATFSQYNAERQGVRSSASSAVLPTAENMRVVRDGNHRYLFVAEPPDKLWPLVREFWQENGFLLTVDMPDAGVMETDWAENRAKLPQDAIRNALGKLLDQVYSTGERDKFRTRLERTADGKGTEIFISHRGMVEQLTGRSGQYDSSMWQPRPPDPELEAEFLSRLMVKLGAEDQRSRAQLAARGTREERAKLVTAAGGASALDVSEPFDRAWRRVGLALDRVGFTVEDRDRSKGIYFVRYVDPSKDGGTKSGGGFLAKLAFWRSGDEPAKAEQYRVVVQQGGDASQVQVLNKDGVPDSSGTSKRILSLLYDQLK
jgi:outer membrane protein assembly factor BamC